MTLSDVIGGLRSGAIHSDNLRPLPANLYLADILYETRCFVVCRSCGKEFARERSFHEAETWMCYHCARMENGTA